MQLSAVACGWAKRWRLPPLPQHRKRPNRVLRAKRKEAEEQAGLEAWSAARHPLERPLIRDDVLRGAGLPLLRAARRRPERMAIETLRALLETAGPLSEAPERPAKRPTEADGATDGSEGPARKRRRLDTGDASAEDRPTPTLRLMTHRWHAKRMQMGRRWGMSVCEGAAGRGRGSRAVLQSLSTSFVLHDASYYEWVGLKGPVEAVGRMLRQCGVPSAVLDDPEVLSGGREFQVELGEGLRVWLQWGCCGCCQARWCNRLQLSLLANTHTFTPSVPQCSREAGWCALPRSSSPLQLRWRLVLPREMQDAC